MLQPRAQIEDDYARLTANGYLVEGWRKRDAIPVAEIVATEML
jgi:hypothetical protein